MSNKKSKTDEAATEVKAPAQPAEPVVEPEPEPRISIVEFQAVAGVSPVMFAGFRVWCDRKDKPLSQWRALLNQFTGGNQ